MMDRDERRKYKRLGDKYDLSYREVGSAIDQAHSGCTVNVGTGGLYFETQDVAFKPGSLLEVELSIPPKRGLLEFGGRISGFARVLRTDIIAAGSRVCAAGRTWPIPIFYTGQFLAAR